VETRLYEYVKCQLLRLNQTGASLQSIGR